MKSERVTGHFVTFDKTALRSGEFVNGIDQETLVCRCWGEHGQLDDCIRLTSERVLLSDAFCRR